MPPLNDILTAIALHYNCTIRQAMIYFDSFVSSGNLDSVVKLLQIEVTADDVAQV